MKPPTRHAHLALLREHARILSGPTALRRDWVELAGEGAPTLPLLLDAGALAPQPATGAKFVGVDTDPYVITDCRLRYADAPAEFVQGNLVSLLAADATRFPNAGVIVFDSWNAARGEEIEESLPPLFKAARFGQARHGEFLLVLNVSLRSVTRATAMVRYKRVVSKLYEHPIPETAWQTYKSSARANPMLLTRLRFGF